MASYDAHTPEQSLPARTIGITEMQKQALISNLQLEITERARKLRTQYGLQAQSLRARLEMRINRIPSALRKRNMQDLLDEQTAKSQPAPPASMPVVSRAAPVAAVAPQSRPMVKRKSEEMSAADDDKENDPLSLPGHEIANPKKRSKTTTVTANTKTARTVSRKAVLSPKSHNSRTLPSSPVKAAPPVSARTATLSTTKSSSSLRAPTKTRSDRDSDASSGSATTTIVTAAGGRAKATTGAPAAATRKTAAKSKATAAPKKAATTAAASKTTTASARSRSTAASAAKAADAPAVATVGAGRSLRSKRT